MRRYVWRNSKNQTRRVTPPNSPPPPPHPKKISCQIAVLLPSSSITTDQSNWSVKQISMSEDPVHQIQSYFRKPKCFGLVCFVCVMMLSCDSRDHQTWHRDADLVKCHRRKLQEIKHTLLFLVLQKAFIPPSICYH